MTGIIRATEIPIDRPAVYTNVAPFFDDSIGSAFAGQSGLLTEMPCEKVNCFNATVIAADPRLILNWNHD